MNHKLHEIYHIILHYDIDYYMSLYSYIYILYIHYIAQLVNIWPPPHPFKTTTLCQALHPNAAAPGNSDPMKATFGGLSSGLWGAWHGTKRHGKHGKIMDKRRFIVGKSWWIMVCSWNIWENYGQGAKKCYFSGISLPFHRITTSMD